MCRVLRLQASSRFCKLGDLSNLVGWKHQATVKALEEKRKVKSKAFYVEKKKAIAVRSFFFMSLCRTFKVTCSFLPDCRPLCCAWIDHRLFGLVSSYAQAKAKVAAATK